MSSHPHPKVSFVTPTTHSGNGDAFPSGRSPTAKHLANDHDAAEHDAIAILMEQLKLTQRQGEALHWIAEGKTNNEIATILGCSVNTVKMHLKDIFQRLDVHTRTAAAACAYRAHIHHERQQRTLPVRGIPEKHSTR